METDSATSGPEPKTPASSVWPRLLNVYAAPGETFEEIRSTPNTAANWLVPALVFILVGIVSTVVIFSQPAIIQQLHDQQARVMDDQVKAGKLTQAQADQALAAMGKFSGPAMLMIFGCIGAVFGGFIHIVWWAFVLWLVGQLVLKMKTPFLKSLEVAGLATMILALGAVVALLLTVITGKLGTTPSLALAVSDFDMKNKTHLLLSAVNVFFIWQIVVAACGLSKLAGVRLFKPLLALLVYWVAFTLLFVMIGLGQFAM